MHPFNGQSSKQRRLELCPLDFVKRFQQLASYLKEAASVLVHMQSPAYSVTWLSPSRPGKQGLDAVNHTFRAQAFESAQPSPAQPSVEPMCLHRVLCRLS
jgi:hypothetical protein